MAKGTLLTVSLFCILWFLIQITNLASAGFPELNNKTADDNQDEKTGRSRRSLHSRMPRTLSITVLNDNGQGIDLVWVKESHFLANKHLPVTLSNNYQIRNAMTVLGDFVVYRDLEECSALVYFEKTNTLSGNVGLEYTITDLPFSFNPEGDYLGTDGFKYIKKRKTPPSHIFPQISDGDLMEIFADCDRYPNGNIESQSNPTPGPSKRRRVKRDFPVGEVTHDQWRQSNMSGINPDRKRRGAKKDSVTYYLEILIFVTNDVVDLYKAYYEGSTYIEMIVKDYIIYFNTIDMMFSQLATSDTEMKINLAKIVLEDGSQHLDVFKSDNKLLFDETVAKRRRHLNEHQHFYPRDSYDFVFVSTSRPIEDHFVLVPGKTDYKPDLYTSRQLGQWFEAVPITIMGYFEYPVLTVHQIARTFNIQEEPYNIGTSHTGQCHSIMQKGSSKCTSCLKWSMDNWKQYQSFFGENRSRCFLLNEPRSLKRAGAREHSSLLKQCQCYGYDFVMKGTGASFYDGYVEEHLCNIPLQCGKIVAKQLVIDSTLPPFDGTRCGGAAKVCWDGHCTPLFFV